MATCTDTINTTLSSGGLSTIPSINPGESNTYSIASGISQLFLIQSDIFQTIQFQVTSTKIPTNVVFSFFRYASGTITNIGSATLSTPSSAFTLDVTSGDYILCVRAPSSSQAGSFIAQFTGYNIRPIIIARLYTGCYLTGLVTTPPITVDCNKPIYFEMIDGSLPPGISLNGQGVLFGQLPNMDCLDDRTNYSPGMNQSFTDNDGYAQPQGRQQRFKVKAQIDGFKETAVDEDQFCIRVHNNQTLDQEKFLAQAPFETVKEIRVVEPVKSLPENVCVPCVQDDPDIFVPVAIDKTPLCGPCGGASAERVELIAIPAQIANIDVNDIVSQYEINRNNLSNSPEVDAFIQSLSESNNFQILRAKAGLVTQELLDQIEQENVYISVEQYLSYVQLAQTRLDPDQDKTSLQYQIREQNIYQNRILPFQMPHNTGEQMTCEIQGDFHVA